MTANWEEEFFSSLSAYTSQNSPDDASDEDIIEVSAALKEPKVKSLTEEGKKENREGKERSWMSLLNVLYHSENITETANNLFKFT